MDTLKNVGNQVSETFQGAASTASKEGNKEQAKNSEASIGTRAEAAKDAVGDKVDEQKHEVCLLSLSFSLDR
ncbi:MAG: hypothetical protein LQ345_001462 [Seirophora villosa]|nr:MAG: hypothetical protein LQ345_001462 [Seirophora villosa]